MLLGATTYVTFAIALSVRHPLVRRGVCTRPPADQPKRQFLIDYALCFLAGMTAILFNQLYHGIGLANGLIFFIGYISFGFFIALDMGLDRERRIILDAIRVQTIMPLPKRYYPMTRKFFLVALVTAALIVIILSLVIARDMSWLSHVGRDGLTTTEALHSVIKELVFIMGVILVLTVNLIFSYAANLKLLFRNETGVLEKVAKGNLSRLVPVVTRDEFGVIAGYTNLMIEGLRHRIRLESALKVAEEVQQNLLPRSAPHCPAAEISGVSLYCEALGGDHFDYLALPGGRLGVVVTDASDHGVGSALHMTTARAFLRFGVRTYDGPASLLGEVNHFLTRDGAESGRFTTLFFMEIDPEARRLQWVRAGHEPALYYHVDGERFERLMGSGIALGVEAAYRYQSVVREGWRPGDLVLIHTDGVREARNPAGEMYGEARIQAVLRAEAGGSAEAIRDALLADLDAFQQEEAPEDDITLVVLKLR